MSRYDMILSPAPGVPNGLIGLDVARMEAVMSDEIAYYPEPDPPDWMTKAGVVTGYLAEDQGDGTARVVMQLAMITDGEGKAWVQARNEPTEDSAGAQ